jgi:hypothetical protein
MNVRIFQKKKKKKKKNSTMYCTHTMKRLHPAAHCSMRIMWFFFRSRGVLWGRKSPDDGGGASEPNGEGPAASDLIAELANAKARAAEAALETLEAEKRARSAEEKLAQLEAERRADAEAESAGSVLVFFCLTKFRPF